MKIFISQPMSGKTDMEVLEERMLIELQLLKEDPHAEFIDSIIEETPECKHPGLWYLGESLKRMADADVVYAAAHAENYRGCKLECTCAKAYGLPVMVKLEDDNVCWHDISLEVSEIQGEEVIVVNCAVPTQGERIMVTDGNRCWEDVFTRDGYMGCRLTSGHLFGGDVIAWRPLKEGEQNA